MAGEKQAVEDCRFAGAVRTENQGEGTNWGVLRLCKGFEVADTERLKASCECGGQVLPQLFFQVVGSNSVERG